MEYSHSIIWDPLSRMPQILLKTGILRKYYPLTPINSQSRNSIVYKNEYVELKGKWKEVDEGCSVLSMRLKNIHDQSIRIARLTFPAENGLESFLEGVSVSDIAFLRNGYQSWSTARSYRPGERPLRPWLQIISQISSNMANLPSNIPGMFSSEMYTVISDKSGGEGFLIGQAGGFHQFFYITLHLRKSRRRASFFKLTYDFGRQLVKPGETIELDPIMFGRGNPVRIQEDYFLKIARQTGFRKQSGQLTGYGTWYYYYDKIHPDQILANLDELSRRDIPLSLFQIDDGYQAQVGDWLDLKPAFEGRMKELASRIRNAGYTPGLWIAPFIANRKAVLAKIHPDYILKDDYGHKITAGYNPGWDGGFYYGLDITNPRYEEYLRNVIRTIVHEWGFTFLKCDFLFGACLRSAVHYRFDISRADILRYGMDVIRDEAGPDAIIEGCGMPLVPGAGTVDLMRIGPDTGPFWIKRTGKLMRTGSMMGVRNSIRNTFVRSLMHNRLWHNDPDCLMLRKNRTKLTRYERHSHINTIILSGGSLLISDNVRHFSESVWDDYRRICTMSRECFHGRCIPLDLMEREIPELVYNTAGYLGIFNMSDNPRTKTLDLSLLAGTTGGIVRLRDHGLRLFDVWSGEHFDWPENNLLVLEKMHARSSRLYRLTG